MAIKIKNLTEIAEQVVTKQYYFKDLHLDLNKSSNNYTPTYTYANTNDLQVDYDVAAIYNSLRNLFNTKPGERFLFPKYGLDLNSYLFEVVSEENAENIATYIISNIEDYEPRVQVVNVEIIANPDQMRYDITIAVSIPVFDTVVSLQAQLDTKTQNFVFINTRTK